MQQQHIIVSSTCCCHGNGGTLRRRRPQRPVAAAAFTGAAHAPSVPPWRQVVGVAAGALLLCNLHRSTFAILLPDLQQQLQLSHSQAGAVQAAMLVAYLAGQVPAGRLADRFSGPPVLLGGLCIWSLATALTATAGLGVGADGSSSGAAWWPLAVIVASRCLMGAASACAMPCVTATAVKWVPPEERGSAVAFVYALFNVGGVIGLTMVPLLAEAFGGGGAFMLAGAAGVGWAAYGALTMRRLQAAAAAEQGSWQQPQQQQQGPLLAKQQLSPQQQHHPQASHSQPGPLQPSQQQQQQQPLSLQRVWQLDAASARQLALLCVTHGIIGFGFFLAQNFLPSYIASLGQQGLAVTGKLSGLPWLAAAVVGMLAGSAADGLIKRGVPPLRVRRLFQAGSFLGCGLSVLPLAASAQPGLVTAVLCLAANLGCYSCSFGGFHPHLQEVAGPSAGLVQGLTNSCSIAAGIAASLLTGWAVDASGNYTAVFGLLAGLYVAAAGLWWAAASSTRLVVDAVAAAGAD